MTSHMGDPKETEVLVGLVDLARKSAPPAAPARMALGFDLVMARVQARQNRWRVVWRASRVVAWGAACVFLVWGAVAMVRARMQPADNETLAYTVEGGSIGDGGYLRESGSAGVRLAFSEGTEFVLMPGARGRLRMVDGKGARIAIEQGSAFFRVAPRQHARWLVDVGPFLVTVNGTVFTIHWDPTTEEFELRLQHGRVSVSGPVSGGAIALRDGQRLRVNLPKAETLITEKKPGEDWPETTSAATEAYAGTSSVPAWLDTSMPQERPTGGAAPSPPAVTPRPATTRTAGEHRWSEAVAAGQWKRILAEAEKKGIRETLNKASSEDLFALADAARYRRRPDLARRALLAGRLRFPDSPRALDAAFLLGRLEEESGHGTARALRWYDEYLAHAPNGTYASEALGRKMIVTSSLDGPARARPIAEDYLRRFPNGTYAGAAQALRRGP